MTSFESIKPAPEGTSKEGGGDDAADESGRKNFPSHNEGEHNGELCARQPRIIGAERKVVMSATRFSFLTDATKPSWQGVPSEEHNMLQNSSLTADDDDDGNSDNIIPRTISDLPIPILNRIFTIAATRSYHARLSLPLVSRAFHNAVLSCEPMWDTFEVMTGNQGALTSKSQVDYVASKAGSGPLSIGLTIAMSRLGAWRSEPRQPWGGGSDDGNGGGARSAQTLQIQGLNLVGTMLSLMPRVREFILDVQDDPLEPALGRAVLALFDDGLAAQLKRVTFVGNYQLDRILKLTTPVTNAPSSVLQPSLASLRHLSIAYCSTFSLPAPLFQMETLEIALVTLEASPGVHYPLENLLLSFPNLVSLEIRMTIDGAPTAQQPQLPQPLSILGITATHAEPPLVPLNRLARLVLECLPLTSSLFSSLVAPNLQSLELTELTLGFDPRDVRFEMSLRELGSGGSKRSSSHGLLPLPLGTFLSRVVENRRIKELTLGGMPDMVVRMCVDFVRAVGGTMDGPGGLTDLHLLGFEWKDWEPMIVPPPLSLPQSASATTSARSEIPLPYLQTVSVFLDHASTWTSKGTVTFDYEAKFDRQGWMEGLMRLAERRMNVQAVVKMFRESKLEVSGWMKTGLSGAHQEEEPGSGRGGGVLEDPLRTLVHVELDAGYKDAYAFVHGAWKAMELERLGHDSSGVEESESAD